MRLFGLNITKVEPIREQARKILEKELATTVRRTSAGNIGIGGRTTKETLDTTSAFDVWAPLARRTTNGLLGLDDKFALSDIRKLPFDQLTDLLTDLSPEIAKSVWDFLLLCNSGYSYKAYNKTTDIGAEINEKAQNSVKDILDKLAENYGTAGIFFDRIFRTLITRGAFLTEVILENGRDFIDIASPDPSTLEFQRRKDGPRGQHWIYGQRIDGVFTSFEDNIAIRYYALHPGPNSIEGHGVLTPAFFSAIFLMSVLRDTKRVIEHQGYLRLDVEILLDKLLATMPTDIQGNSEQTEKWLKKAVTDVQSVYSSLEPDETYIHTDHVKVNKPVGTASSDSLKAIDSIFQVLERMLTRGLKSMPILMATNQSRSETQANREWEIFALGVENLQHLVECMMEYNLELALRAQGIQAKLEFRFAQFRASEELRDTQVDLLKGTVARYNYDCGYWSQDEAAHYATGKDRADQPEPRVVASVQDSQKLGGQINEANQNPDPGKGGGRSDALDIKEIQKRYLSNLSGHQTNGHEMTREELEQYLIESGHPELLEDLAP